MGCQRPLYLRISCSFSSSSFCRWMTDSMICRSCSVRWARSGMGGREGRRATDIAPLPPLTQTSFHPAIPQMKSGQKIENLHLISTKYSPQVPLTHLEIFQLHHSVRGYGIQTRSALQRRARITAVILEGSSWLQKGNS